MPDVIHTSAKGLSMKKTALVVLLATAMVLVFAASAFAAVNTGGYIAWNAGGPNAGSLGTPHKDYQLTTEKCAVCHAVHRATTTGQILLSDTVANACTFCHVTVGGAGNVIVYNGVAGNFTADTNNNHSNACTGCHAVHGAGTVNSGIASLDAKILRETPLGISPQAGTGWNYATAVRQEAVSRFCSACHPYFVGNYEATHSGSFGAGTFDGHIMTATINNYSNPNKTTGETNVAFASSAYCRSCHDAGNFDQGTGVWADNFPHFTGGVRFMKAGTSSAAAPVDATSAAQDGACLKCHRNGAGSGVGLTF